MAGVGFGANGTYVFGSRVAGAGGLSRDTLGVVRDLRLVMVFAVLRGGRGGF